MPVTATSTASLRFGHFELQANEQRLLAHGAPVLLRPRAFSLLQVLAERQGRLVTRAELLDLVWPGLVVEENNLSVQINALRKVLGNEIVATVPGRGYRFVAPLLGERAPAPALRLVRTRFAHHLPEAPTPLLGREQELRVLGEQLAQHRLVSLVGAGGIGKTRLAQAQLMATQAQHEHGVCFVELGAVAADASVPAAVAAALGLRLGEHEHEDAFASLAHSLAPLTLLLALDNAEHLIPGVAATAAALLAGAPGVRMLVTSQVPLNLREERVVRLGALAVPELGASPDAALRCGAVALFVARAQALDHRFELTAAQVDDVIRLCRQLDGCALAIELAAARLPLLGLPALVQRLSQRLGLLTQGQRGAPARQQTLRAALEWSWSLLSVAEQQVFRRLAVFVGSASLAQIEQVVADDPADPWATLDALGALVDRSLVNLVSQLDEALPRYRLLDSPATLARELLAASGETTAIQARHGHALRVQAEHAHADLMAGRLRLGDWLDTQAPDVGNSRVAFDWALRHEPAAALTIAPTLSLAIGRHRYNELIEIWNAIEPLLDAHPPPAPPAVMARAAWGCAEQWQMTRVAYARQRAEQAHAIAEAAGLAVAAFLPLKVMAAASWRQGDRAGIEVAVAAVQRLEQPAWPPFLRAMAASVRAWLALHQQEYAQAAQWFSLQAEWQRADGVSDAMSVNNLIHVLMSSGRAREAAEQAQELVQRLSGERDLAALSFSYANLSAALLCDDRAAEARAVLIQSWPVLRRFDSHPQWADDAALVCALEGRAAHALRLIGFADAAFATLGQTREPVDQQRIERAERLARAGLATADPVSFKAAGARVRVDDLLRLAFEDAAPEGAPERLAPVKG